MTMASRGFLRVRRGLAALAAVCLLVLAGCSHTAPPAPVATSLPSAPTWLCPGVPWEAVGVSGILWTWGEFLPATE